MVALYPLFQLLLILCFRRLTLVVARTSPASWDHPSTDNTRIVLLSPASWVPFPFDSHRYALDFSVCHGHFPTSTNVSYILAFRGSSLVSNAVGSPCLPSRDCFGNRLYFGSVPPAAMSASPDLSNATDDSLVSSSSVSPSRLSTITEFDAIAPAAEPLSSHLYKARPCPDIH